MKSRLLIVACALSAIAAPVHASLLSATGAIIAILGGELFVGAAEGHLDGSGTLAIHSQRQPSLTCSGDFVSSPAEGGSGRLDCSDGTRAAFRFVRITIFRGHGSGSFSRGPMTFSYGLSAEEAKPFLAVPAGKHLVRNGTELELADL